MSTFTIGVIDTACESADQSFFPPSVKLSAVSTTIIGTLLGFSEYGQFQSSPPKKYRRLTYQGTSQLICTSGGVQIAGALYTYSGATEIDFSGNLLSTYTKFLSEMCSAADKQCQGIGFLSNVGLSPAVAAFNVPGWIGFPASPSCTGSGIPFTGIGDRSIKTGQAALYDLGLPSGVIFGSGEVFSNYNFTFTATSATTGSDTAVGTQAISIFNTPLPCGTQVAQGPALDTTSSAATLNWNQAYSATLDEEYTEANALANGKTYTGGGTTAAYIRNGFTVTQTTVAWTLNITNLLAGHPYTATYQLFNPTLGTTQTISVPFVPSGTTFSIIGTITAPPSGQSITIRNPTVAFST